MAPRYTGHCFCEAVQYRITEEPLTRVCIQCQTRLWSEPETDRAEGRRTWS